VLLIVIHLEYLKPVLQRFHRLDYVILGDTVDSSNELEDLWRVRDNFYVNINLLLRYLFLR